MKTEIDYVVEKQVNNAMIIKAKYINNRLKMLEENPTVNKENFIVIECEENFCRYNEVNGNKMNWVK